MTIEISESLKREIGQHFVLGFPGLDVTPGIVSLIQEYYVGAIIIMKRNVQDVRQLRTLIAKLQSAAREAGHDAPLLIGIDQENGLVSAFSRDTPLGGTQFPGPMALAATDDPVLVEKVYAATASEMRLCGINWDYAPVCDINSEPKNPVIDPSKVSELAAAAAKGLTSQGIAPSPKHFPGHGDTHIDSHLGLPRIMKTIDELEHIELVPFKHLINNGVATVMTGHMALPLISGDDKPCSLSRVITHNLLREKLGYNGVVVTDCLEMDAIVKTYGTEDGAVEALKAGADIVMICHRFEKQIGAIKAVYSAFLSDGLSKEDLTASGKRIQYLKERYVGSWDDVIVPDIDIPAFEKQQYVNKSVQQEAYLRGVVVLQDTSHILPLPKAPGSIVLFTPIIETLNRAIDDPESAFRTPDGTLKNIAGPSYLLFAKAILEKSQTSSVQHVVYGPHDNPSFDLPATTTIIFATRQADQSSWQLKYLSSFLQTLHAKQPIIVLATLTPYEVLSPIAGMGAAYMCTFEYTAEALQSAASIIFGESSPHGVLPVKSAPKSSFLLQ
ncbi:hypothetical protein Clacol_007343 [Clathrus columnatus]|uniref:Glycoside hydrolase family 3 N-terminal domain-containing protein n=1 Tax=Clathrus columnatus TaxID=1419009 RepID=A0AAV5AK73_9AGAM|nr:hypothetical protein Clacol_007343 [Clathrus columnatus]